MSARSPITTHVLDTSRGRPAAGVPVTLERINTSTGDAERLAEGQTNDDGRIEGLLPPGSLPPGRYRLCFGVAEYFERLSAPAFYPEVTIDFTVAAGDEHYHVPLLLSPFGYSTYRGS